MVPDGRVHPHSSALHHGHLFLMRHPVYVKFPACLCCFLHDCDCYGDQSPVIRVQISQQLEEAYLHHNVNGDLGHLKPTCLRVSGAGRLSLAGARRF